MKILKEYCLFLFIFILIACNSMEYKVLDCFEAANLKKSAKFLINIEFNLSSVYSLNDSSYLVMPLNPLGKSMLIKNKNLLEQFINEKYFPDNEEANKFYFDNKQCTDNLIKCKEKLKIELIDYVFKGGNHFQEENSLEQIDYVYETLKKRKAIKKYKLNFIVLIGDFIIRKYGNNDIRWGLVAKKQLLNPIMNLVLIKDEKNGIYFDIEESIFGKYSYSGIRMVIHEMDTYTQKSNQFDTIVKVM